MIKNNMTIAEKIEKVTKAGFTAENGCVSYHYDGIADKIVVIGERRTLVAYEKGNFYTLEAAKRNATQVCTGPVCGH